MGLSAKWTLAWTWVAPLLLPLTATADTGLEVRSPNGQVVSTLQVRDCGPARGCLLYRVALRGRPVLVESRLGLEVEEGSLERDLSIVGQARTHRDARWRPPYGERTTIPDRYNSVTIDLAAAGPPARRMKVECRAYDEGVAFRYVLPAPPVGGWRIRQERSEFRFAPGSTAYPIHETEETFPTEAVPIDEVKPGALIPLTVRLRDGGVASVLEAHVLDYPRMTLGRTPDGALVTRLRGPVESGGGIRQPVARRPAGGGGGAAGRERAPRPELEPALRDRRHVLDPARQDDQQRRVRSARDAGAREGRGLRLRERLPLPPARLGVVRDRVGVDGRGARHVPPDDARAGRGSRLGGRTPAPIPSRSRRGRCRTVRTGRASRTWTSTCPGSSGTGAIGTWVSACMSRPTTPCATWTWTGSSRPTASGVWWVSSPASSGSARRRTRTGSAAWSRPQRDTASGCASTTATCRTGWSGRGRTSSSAKAAAGRKGITRRRTT